MGFSKHIITVNIVLYNKIHDEIGNLLNGMFCEKKFHWKLVSMFKVQ